MKRDKTDFKTSPQKNLLYPVAYLRGKEGSQLVMPPPAVKRKLKQKKLFSYRFAFAVHRTQNLVSLSPAKA